MKENNGNYGKDESLNQVYKADAYIQEKYLSGVGSDEEARADAVHYIQVSLKYAKEHPGVLEDIFGEDFQKEEIETLTKLLEQTNSGNWEPMKEFLKNLGKGFLSTYEWLESPENDTEWSDLGNAFINLADSL